MKKLKSFALYAIVTPVLAMGAGTVLAQPGTGLDTERAQLIAQRDQSATQGDRATRSDGRSDSKTVAGGRNNRDESRTRHRGHLKTTPANASHASNLMGTDVKTADGEKVGSVDDLIIDQDGQVVAIIVGVGGFLGMGEKDVAIGWDNVSRTNLSKDDKGLRVDVTRQNLRAAPEFEKRD